MCRTSSFLAIALSVTTLACASVPAAAGFVKTPQVSKAYNPHRRTTVGSAMYPMGHARTTMGSAEMPTRFPSKGKK